MPHYDTPNWNDVHWDHRASDEAIGALRRVGAAIDRVLADELWLALAAADQWRGTTRSSFETRRGSLRDELARLAEACRGAAEQTRRAGERAAEEQRRREREREAWEHEEERRRRSSGTRA